MRNLLFVSCAALVFTFSAMSTSRAAFFDGPGEDSTWIYNSANGDLKLRLEQDHRYNTFVMNSGLAHFNTGAGLMDRFLMATHPGFQGINGVPAVREQELHFFITDTDLPCADCLGGTLDFGRIMNPGISKAQILANWFAVNSFVPFGGEWSDDENPDRSFGIEYLTSVQPPKVDAVFVNRQAWTERFRSQLPNTISGLTNVGYAIPDSSDQVHPLPWIGIDELIVSFSDSVNVQSSDLALIGSAGGPVVPMVSSFEMLDQFTAAWTFSQPLDANRYKIELSDSITGASSNLALDGEWSNGVTNGQSGNGIAGGQFNFDFNILPGDIGQSGGVSVDDVTPLRNLIGRDVDDPLYSIFADQNGTGKIAVDDLGPTRINLGDFLPARTELVVVALPEPHSFLCLVLTGCYVAARVRKRD